MTDSHFHGPDCVSVLCHCHSTGFRRINCYFYQSNDEKSKHLHGYGGTIQQYLSMNLLYIRYVGVNYKDQSLNLDLRTLLDKNERVSCCSFESE